MFRILLLITLLLNVCELVPSRFGTYHPVPSHPATSCLPSGSKQQDNNVYKSVTHLFGEVEAKLREVCSHFPNIRVRDIYTADKYLFEANLAEFGNYNGFDVRIKHRTMCIVGHIPRKDQCDLSYVSITVLPEFLNFHDATWTYDYNNLVVSIPYKYNITDEVDQNCYNDIDDTLIMVRKG